MEQRQCVFAVLAPKPDAGRAQGITTVAPAFAPIRPPESEPDFVDNAADPLLILSAPFKDCTIVQEARPSGGRRKRSVLPLPLAIAPFATEHCVKIES